MDGSNIVAVRIRKWSEFFELSLKMRYQEWFFRGHADASWELTTSLDRDVNGARMCSNSDFQIERLVDFDKEHQAIRNFSDVAERYISGLADEVEILAVMQHYGTYTRLMDFTASIYVALYFAFDDVIKQQDRAIFAINRKALVRNSPSVQRAFNERFDAEVSGMCDADDDYLKVESDKWVRCLETDYLFQESLFKQIVEAHFQQMDYFEMDVVPVIIDRPNHRMKAQVGMFLLPLTFRPFVENLRAALKVPEDVKIEDYDAWRQLSTKELVDELGHVGLVRMVFDKSLIQSSQQVLAQANMFTHTVYPDLVGMARGMRCWCA